MFWFCVWQVVSTLVELVRWGRRSESAKDFEILLLRRQLAIYERRQERALQLSRGEKLKLIVLGTKLKTQTGRTIKAMGEVIRIVKPASQSWPSTDRQGNRAAGVTSGTRKRLGL